MRISDWSSDVCSSDRGVLAEARISGEDVGTQIDDSQHRSADIGAEIARLEARLKQGGLGDRERTELQQQLAALRERLDSERTLRRSGEAMLATTPMVFDYVGTGGLPGIGYGNPFSRSEEHTSELQSLMRISYAVFCLKKKKKSTKKTLQ